MHSIIIQMVIMLHAAFGCMFAFFFRQHRSRVSRVIAQSCLLDAVRAAIILSQLGLGREWANHWYVLWDCLGVVATWWLLAGCADLMEARLPANLGRYYIWITLPLIVAMRYPLPWGLAHWLGMSADQAGRLGVLAALIVIFVPVTIARATVLYWLVSAWRRTGQPGA